MIHRNEIYRAGFPVIVEEWDSVTRKYTRTQSGNQIEQRPFTPQEEEMMSFRVAGAAREQELEELLTMTNARFNGNPGLYIQRLARFIKEGF